MMYRNGYTEVGELILDDCAAIGEAIVDDVIVPFVLPIVRWLNRALMRLREVLT